MKQYTKEEIRQYYKNLAFLFTWTFAFGTLSDYALSYFFMDLPWWMDAIIGFVTNFAMLVLAICAFIDKNIVYV